jgi:hypothetical protein
VQHDGKDPQQQTQQFMQRAIQLKGLPLRIPPPPPEINLEPNPATNTPDTSSLGTYRSTLA